LEFRRVLFRSKYVDYLASYGPLILGHGYPEVKAAMMEQIEDGSILYGTPHALEAEMAKKLQEHFPSLEMIRYTNSGTEATLFSHRLAYAFTGKYKIDKFEGDYHDGYNKTIIRVNSDKGEVRRLKPVTDT